MKKTVTLSLLAAILFTLMVPAFAAEGLMGLNIKIPDEVMELIEKADVNELAGMVKTYLDTVRNMTDEEIYQSLREFCDKYHVEVTDTQLKSLTTYAKKAVDFDTKQIKDEIESVRKKVGFLARLFAFLKKIVVAVVNVIISIFKAIFSLFSAGSTPA